MRNNAISERVMEATDATRGRSNDMHASAYSLLANSCKYREKSSV